MTVDKSDYCGDCTQSEASSSLMNSAVAAGVSGLIGSQSSFFFEGLKKRAQSNQKIPGIKTLGMKTWCKESMRGSLGFALSVTPTSILQQLTNHYFENSGLPDTLFNRVGRYVASGGMGGIASTVVENVILEQQLKKLGAKQAFLNLIQQGGARVFRGLPLIMARESIFGFCYLKGADTAAHFVTEKWGAKYSLPAKLTVGALGSLVSHPLDTLATTMQKDNCKNITDAAVQLYKENGIKSFYKGAGFRIGLFTTAMLTISNTKEFVQDRLDSLSANL